MCITTIYKGICVCREKEGKRPLLLPLKARESQTGLQDSRKTVNTAPSYRLANI